MQKGWNWLELEGQQICKDVQFSNKQKLVGAEEIIENEQGKILWDFWIQIGGHVEHNILGTTKCTWIIDISVPSDSHKKHYMNIKELQTEIGSARRPL